MNTRTPLINLVHIDNITEFETSLREHEVELVKRVIAWTREKRVGITDPGHWGPNCDPPFSDIPDPECVLKSIEGK